MHNKETQTEREMNPSNDELITEMKRLNANLEALLSTSQGELLVRLVEILSNLQEIAAKELGYTIGRDLRS